MRGKPLAVLFVTILIDLLGFGVIIPILPIYTKELGAGNLAVSLVGFVFPLMQFLFAPLMGTISDRFGRKPIIAGSLYVNIVGYTLFANATTVPLLFMGRLLNGIGSANLGAAQAYIADVVPIERRAKAYGIIGAAFGLGFIFGPPLGGMVKEYLGMGAVGYTLVALCVINLAIVHLFLPESIKAKNHGGRLNLNPLHGMDKAWARPALRWVISMNFVYVIAFSLMQLASALLWKERYGLKDLHISYLFMYIGFMSALFQGGLVGIMAKHMGEHRMLLVGSLLVALGLGFLAAPGPPSFVAVELACLGLMALGNAMLMPALTSLVSKNSDERSQGAMLGINQSMSALARAIGFLFSASLYGLLYYLPFVLGAALMAFVLLMGLAFGRIGQGQKGSSSN
jgi:MFS family permease